MISITTSKFQFSINLGIDIQSLIAVMYEYEAGICPVNISELMVFVVWQIQGI